MDFEIIQQNLAPIGATAAGLLYILRDQWLPLLKKLKSTFTNKPVEQNPREVIFHHWNQLYLRGCPECREELDKLLPQLLHKQGGGDE